MTALAADTVVDNPLFAAARPRLSVLTPFHRDDPAILLEALDRQTGVAPGAVELILLDDGTGDGGLSARTTAAVLALPLPVRFVTLHRNAGRAAGRNRLAAEARGAWRLFLDADMRPDSPRFLAAWLQLIEEQAPAIAFGGFTVEPAPADRRFALHAAMAARSDCLSAAQRALDPAKSVFTSNLLVRSEVFDAHPFDGGFTGWGWEDVEWAARAGAAHPIVHIDNTATHLGLEAAETLARKYEQSAGNFARLLAAHPAVVRAWPVHRWARRLARLPLRALWRPWLKRLALAEAAPLPARALGLRLYRAALYADVV